MPGSQSKWILTRQLTMGEGLPQEVGRLRGAPIISTRSKTKQHEILRSGFYLILEWTGALVPSSGPETPVPAPPPLSCCQTSHLSAAYLLAISKALPSETCPCYPGAHWGSGTAKQSPLIFCLQPRFKQSGEGEGTEVPVLAGGVHLGSTEPVPSHSTSTFSSKELRLAQTQWVPEGRAHLSCCDSAQPW